MQISILFIVKLLIEMCIGCIKSGENLVLVNTTKYWQNYFVQS